MKPRLLASVETDIAAFAASGREVLDILPHRGLGKAVGDTVLSLPFDGTPAIVITAHLDEFDPERLGQLLQRVNDGGFDILKIVPHRHGQVVKMTVYGVAPVRLPQFDWEVECCRDYETDLTDAITELHTQGWQWYDIIPYREGAKNFPILIVRRPKP